MRSKDIIESLLVCCHIWRGVDHNEGLISIPINWGFIFIESIWEYILWIFLWKSTCWWSIYWSAGLYSCCL